MDLADSYLEPEGFWCIEAEWNQHDEVLRLFVDKEGGVGMDDCVSATRQLRDQNLLSDREAGSYNLEVSSPGLERPLRRLSDFRSYLGQEVSVHFTEIIEGKRKIEGVLQDVHENGDITLETSDGNLVFSLTSLHKASLIYKWGI